MAGPAGLWLLPARARLRASPVFSLRSVPRMSASRRTAPSPPPLALGADLGAGILPARAVVLVDKTVERPFGYPALGLHESGKDSVQIFGVLEVVADDRRGIGVVHDEGLEERVRCSTSRCR